MAYTANDAILSREDLLGAKKHPHKLGNKQINWKTLLLEASVLGYFETRHGNL